MGETRASAAPCAIIIDDQRALAELLAERLSLDGFQTTVTSTATEGLALSANRSYDVAFVDLKLPDMSGIAAAAELKKRSDRLRVILVTGFASSTDDAEMRWAHIDAVLPKPWKPSELDAILRMVGRKER